MALKPEPQFSEPKNQHGWRVYAGVGLVVILAMFACGRLATLAPMAASGVEVLSRLDADYRPWHGEPFVAFSPRLLIDLAESFGPGASLGVSAGDDCLLPQGSCEVTPEPTLERVAQAGTETPPPSAPSPSPTAAPPTKTPSATLPPPTATHTPTRRPPTKTPTPTATFTPSSTPTNTATPLPSLTPTPTYSLTFVTPGAAEPDIGTPDGAFYSIPSGQGLVFDLGTKPVVVKETPDADPELVYYEREWSGGRVLLDWVIVEIATSQTGQWFVVFNWGDQVPDANTNVATHGADGEDDNESIPMTDLYGTPPLNTGISIDAESVVPTPGIYSWLRILSPYGGGDAAEVDAVEILPTKTPTPTPTPTSAATATPSPVPPTSTFTPSAVPPTPTPTSTP